MKIKKKLIKFGILGLGKVVEIRISKVFKNEVKNSKVVAVYDKNKKKIKNLANFLIYPPQIH